MKYRQRPIEVEAWKWNGQNLEAGPSWIKNAYHTGILRTAREQISVSYTGIPEVHGVRGDFIIFDDGRLSIVPQRDFYRRFEEVKIYSLQLSEKENPS